MPLEKTYRSVWTRAFGAFAKVRFASERDTTSKAPTRTSRETERPRIHPDTTESKKHSLRKHIEHRFVSWMSWERGWGKQWQQFEFVSLHTFLIRGPFSPSRTFGAAILFCHKIQPWPRLTSAPWRLFIVSHLSLYILQPFLSTLSMTIKSQLNRTAK